MAKKTLVPDGTCAKVIDKMPGHGVCEGYLCDGKANSCDNKCISASECFQGYTCSKSACKAYKIAFVTSTTYRGNLGGALGADKLCQERAEAAGLSGTYMAWIGDSITSPLTRFSQWDGPYAKVTQGKVADDWKDLSDGSLDSTMTADEFGKVSGGTLNAWIGMEHPAVTPSVSNCLDWTSKTATDQGTYLSSLWSSKKTSSCAAEMRLYCFEQ